MMSLETELRNMVTAFRVTELQTLLLYAGKNKNGRKNELQSRALELIKKNSTSNHIVLKIRELYRSIQLSTLSQQPPASANVPNPGYRSDNNPFSHGTTTTSNTATLGAMQAQRLYNQSQYNSMSDKSMSQNRNPFGTFGLTKMPGLQALGLGGLGLQQGQGVPYCPDVRMKRLPFFDILTELHKPTSLIGQGGRVLEANFPFFLTPSQAGDVASSKEYSVSDCGEAKIQYALQIQLRFCVIDPSADQEDVFPPSMAVRMNGKVVPLPHPIPSNRPGVEPKRPSRPLNVTNYVKLSPTVTNQISVQWTSDVSGKQYAMALYLVKKLCAQTLLTRLKSKGPRQKDFTRGMIKDICKGDDSDCCVATTSLKVSLACPLGKCRMSLPCRATTCAHLQCFDANLFLQMNEKKPTWLCPVCDKPLLFDSLAIDGYFDEIIKNVPISCGNDVEILADGTWSVATTVKKEPSDPPPAKKMKTSNSSKMNETIDLDDELMIEDEIEESQSVKVTNHSSDPPKSSGPADIIDLTLSSSESECESEAEVEAEEQVAPISQEDDKGDNDKSDEEQIGRARRRVSKPNYVVDDSSSDSSTSTRGPDSPGCIILDSPTPSPPEPRNGSNFTSNSTSRPGSGSSYAPYNQQPSMPTLESLSYGGMSGVSGVAPPLTRSQSNALERGNMSSMMFPNSSSIPTYLPYDSRAPWDPAYPMATDFTALDFPSMDYFNQTSFNSNQNNPPGGSGGGGAAGGGNDYGTTPRW